MKTEVVTDIPKLLIQALLVIVFTYSYSHIILTMINYHQPLFCTVIHHVFWGIYIYIEL